MSFFTFQIKHILFVTFKCVLLIWHLDKRADRTEGEFDAASEGTLKGNEC